VSGETAIERYSLRIAVPIAELDAIPVGSSPCASTAASPLSIASSALAPLRAAPATPTTSLAGNELGSGATAKRIVSSILLANAEATRLRT
jgi:hypothetical protein